MGTGWGPLPRAPLGRVAKSDTVKKVYKLYWSTYIHTHTHLWIGESTWPQGYRDWGRGWQLVMWLCHGPPSIGKALSRGPASQDDGRTQKGGQSRRIWWGKGAREA